MEFRFTREQEAFRQEIRAFVRRVLPPDWQGVDPDAEFEEEWWPLVRRVTRALAERGWLTLHWPREYGGQGRPLMDQVILKEEMAYWRVPIRDAFIGTELVGPCLMLFGTEEQRREFLPGIARGDLVFAQGFSEPESGSDLASLRTRAVEDGDEFVITGSKIWTSGAHRSTHIFLLARTDPRAPKHKGLTMFLVPMDSPGIAVTPIPNLLGVHYFNQVFLDGVRVPKRYVLGEVNRGWYVAATALDFERSGVDRFASNRRALEDLARLAREVRRDGEPLARNPLVRHRLADLYIANRAGTLIAYRVAWLQSQGQVPNKEASMSKLFGSELAQRIYALGVEMLGPYGLLDKGSRRALRNGRLAWEWANSFSLTIRAGTSEIQRNIIAQRGLGLPRS